MAGKKKYSAAEKRRIANDWKALFPTLRSTGTRFVAKRNGPLEIGIVLDATRSGDRYAPWAYLNTLLNPATESTIAVDTYGIAVGLHEREYEKRADELARSLPLLKREDLDFAEVSQVIWSFILGEARNQGRQMPVTVVNPRPVYEDLVLLSGFGGLLDYARDLIDYAQASMRDWPEGRRHGLDIDRWGADLGARIAEPAALGEVMEAQAAKRKLSKASEFALTYDAEPERPWRA